MGTEQQIYDLASLSSYFTKGFYVLAISLIATTFYTWKKKKNYKKVLFIGIMLVFVYLVIGGLIMMRMVEPLYYINQ